MRRGALLAAAVLLVAGCGSGASEEEPAGKVRHVFVVVLENKSYGETFGAGSDAFFLARELPRQGQLLRRYYGTTHRSLGNYLAMISGQGPTRQIQENCPVLTAMRPARPAPDGQVLGDGCVYPPAVKTLPDQLEQRGLRWGGYFQDMGRPCRHPGIGEPDPTREARPGDQYAVRHNPFVYFRSITDTDTCRQHVLDLSELPGHLANAATTPAFSLIVPDLCDDGHDDPCVDGRPGGLISADGWLREWIPQIQLSPAFRAGGLLVITFDEGADDDRRSCCDQQAGPNVYGKPGGGRVGAVVLSPFVEPGSVNDTPYNHYSLLRTVEDLFGLDHLGYAGRAGVEPFGDDVLGRE